MSVLDGMGLRFNPFDPAGVGTSGERAHAGTCLG